MVFFVIPYHPVIFASFSRQLNGNDRNFTEKEFISEEMHLPYNVDLCYLKAIVERTRDMKDAPSPRLPSPSIDTSNMIFLSPETLFLKSMDYSFSLNNKLYLQPVYEIFPEITGPPPKFIS